MTSAYSAVENRDIETVVILSRVHREPAKTVFLPQFTSYATPLGELQVDQTILEGLAHYSEIFKFDNIPHVEEHSIEVQLPFVKYLWPDAKIVPILTGKSSVSLANKLAASLREILKEKLEKTLFVISSSSSSYDTAEKTIKETDKFISLLNSSDQWELLPDMLNEGEIGACSADCLYAVLKVQKENVSIEMLEMEYGQNSAPEEKRVCFGAFSLR
jgi:AmmeMemoRadiSam system protein B